MSDAEKDGVPYDPSFRQLNVDETLDEHERRLSRLEKVMYIVMGYMAAAAPEVITVITGFL